MTYYSLNDGFSGSDIEIPIGLATDTPRNIDQNNFTYPDEVEIGSCIDIEKPNIFILDTHGIGITESLLSVAKIYNVKSIPISVANSEKQIYKIVPVIGPHLMFVNEKFELEEGDHSRLDPNEFIFSGASSKDPFVIPSNKQLWEEPFLSHNFFTDLAEACNKNIPAGSFFCLNDLSGQKEIVDILKIASFKITSYIRLNYTHKLPRQEELLEVIKKNRNLTTKEKIILIKKIKT